MHSNWFILMLSDRCIRDSFYLVLYLLEMYSLGYELKCQKLIHKRLSLTISRPSALLPSCYSLIWQDISALFCVACMPYMMESNVPPISFFFISVDLHRFFFHVQRLKVYPN